MTDCYGPEPCGACAACIGQDEPTDEELRAMQEAEREAFPLICMTVGRCRTKQHKALDAEALRMDRRQARSHRRRSARAPGFCVPYRRRVIRGPFAESALSRDILAFPLPVGRYPP